VLFDKLLMKVCRAKRGETSSLAAFAIGRLRMTSVSIDRSQFSSTSLATTLDEANRVILSTGSRLTIDELAPPHMMFFTSRPCQCPFFHNWHNTSALKNHSPSIAVAISSFVFQMMICQSLGDLPLL
jgi:hypothetical protein